MFHDIPAVTRAWYMDVHVWVIDYGLFGLALIAFLAATVLPFSSEVAVVAALQLGLSPVAVLVYAAAGNSLGAMTNYGLGWLLTKPALKRLRRQQWGVRALTWARRYGGWCLAASWMPLVGDPIMLVGGVLRFHAGYTIGLGLGTRVARYAVLIGFLGLADTL
jgi:membrane protein YqaA with SNARE-associated domain